MKWLRPILAVSVLALILAGCGVKNVEVPPAPQVESLLETAWELYDNGNYETALDTFEAAINLDVFNYEAYLGRGLCQSMLGEYDDAHTSFTLAISILTRNQIKLATEAIVADSEAFATGIIDTSSYADTSLFSGHTQWKLKLSHTPFIGLENITISGNKPELKGFDSDVLYLVDYLPSPGETVLVYYYYYDTTMVPTDENVTALDTFLTWAYASNASAYVAQEEDLMRAITHAAAALIPWKTLADTANLDFPTFTHYPNFTERDVAIIYALATFKNEFYYNTVKIIKTYLDPEWSTFDGNEWSAFAPDSYPQILQKLEDLIKSNE